MYHKSLLSPIKLTDKVVLKNRMIKSPQSTMYWDPDYFMSDRVIDFYESIAEGGASLILLGRDSLVSRASGRNLRRVV